MLMILLSTVNVSWYLICGKRWLVAFNAGKTQLALFDQFRNSDAIEVKMDGSALEEKSSFEMPELSFSSKLNWGSYIISTAKTTAKKVKTLIRTINFPSPEVALYVYKSTIPSCMEYCCHFRAGAPRYYLDKLNNLRQNYWSFIFCLS